MFSREYHKLIYGLAEFLNPHFISTHATDIFEETLIKAAGVETQPKKCQFGPDPDKAGTVYFRIKGISRDEAEKLQGFFKQTCEDENASMSYIPDNHFVEQDSRDSYYFNVDILKVNAKLLPLFKEQFASISKDKLAAYVKQSVNDERVVEYKRDLLETRKRKLLQELNSFLLPEFVSIYKCDVFEETLQKIAGLEGKSSKCRFDMLSFDKLYFKIKGVSEKDAEKFLGLLKEAGDESATMSFTKVDEEADLNESYKFVVNADVVVDKLIPKFKDAFKALATDVLEEYRKLSESDYGVIDAKRRKARQTWDNLVKGIEEFLNTLLISCYPTDIFEETLLKLAGVAAKPEKCQFAPVERDGYMYVRVKGINDEDAEKFLTFLREKCGDATATTKFVKTADHGYGSELTNCHHFEVKTDMVLNTLLPQFKDDVKQTSEQSPEKLDGYRKQSENHENVKSVKLARLFTEIAKLSAELKSVAVNEFTKGELNILFRMLDPALASYEKHRVHGCAEASTASEQLAQSVSIFHSVVAENAELKDNETAKKLSEELKTYFPVAKKQNPMSQIFRLFGVPSDQMPSDDELEQMEEMSCDRGRVHIA